MRLRQKYAVLTLVALLAGVAGIMLMSVAHLHGYALLPLVILVGLSLYVAFESLIYTIVPPKNPKSLAEDTFWDLVLNAAFGHFFK